MTNELVQSTEITSLSSIRAQLPGQYTEFLTSDGKRRLADSAAQFLITNAQLNPDGNFGVQWELTIAFPQYDAVYRLSFNVDETKMDAQAAETRSELFAAIAKETASKPVGPCVLKRVVLESGNSFYFLASAKQELPF